MRERGDGALDVPRAVLLKAEALGEQGRAWLAGLPDLLREVAREWGLTVGPALHGGSAGYVAAVTTADGADAVLKLQLPGYDSLADEMRVLRVAGGRGYARLLRGDETRRAMLVERLGPPLSSLGLPVARQIAIICATLRRAWIQPPATETFMTGAEKAMWLRAFIVDTWQALGRPCSQRVIERAVTFCDRRAAAFDPARSVLVHGDAHGANTLAPLGLGADGGPGAPPSATNPPGRASLGELDQVEFKLIDPDGLFAEPACDLAALMRDWSGDLLAGDPVRLGRERGDELARLTGVDPEPIWQWGFMERVSTGLMVLTIDNPVEGHAMLRVAEAWAAV